MLTKKPLSTKRKQECVFFGKSLFHIQLGHFFKKQGHIYWPLIARVFFCSSTGRFGCVPRTVAIPAGRRLDGFATWFECDFGDGSPKLSTAPAAQATHWKQTIFYLREPVEGEGHEVFQRVESDWGKIHLGSFLGFCWEFCLIIDG